MLGIDFTLPGRQFAVQWDSTSVVSEANITGFLLSIQSPGGLTCDDTSSISDATESLCSWDESAVGQTHNFSVSALICGGTQEGAWSDSVSITLQSQGMVIHYHHFKLAYAHLQLLMLYMILTILYGKRSIPSLLLFSVSA